MTEIDRSDTTRQNSTPYFHPQETNLLNVHKAMEYNGQGEPILRTLSTVDGSPAGTTAFGEPYGITLSPVIQLDALYGLPTTEFETFSASSGSATTERDMFKVSTGTSVGGYGVIRSRRLARYRPGQGMMCRFTASFTTPVTGTTQRAGFFSQEQALQIGYDGTRFGILRQNDGKAELRVLTLSADASGAGETATITVNGTSYTVALTNSSIEQNCAEIAAAGATGYILDQEDGKVYFFASSNGPQSGTFSFSSTGTAAGTFSQLQAGVADVNNWTYQEDFNIDKLDGTGTSGITLDFTKLNIFQISFRWLGAGEMRFACENPNTGDMMYFHHIRYSNRNTDVSLDNPSFKLGYVAANLSASTIPDLVVRGGSMAAFNEGMVRDTAYPSSIGSTKTSLGTNTWHHILSIKSPLVFTNKVNLKNMIIERLSVAFQGNDPLELILVLDGTPSTTLIYNKVDATDTTAAYYSTTTATFTNPIRKFSTVVNINGGVNLDVANLNISMSPQSVISVAARSTQPISKLTASIVWNEV